MDTIKVSRRELLLRTLKIVAAAAVMPLILIKRGGAAQKQKPKTEVLRIDLQDKEYAALNRSGGALYVDVAGEALPVIVHRISETEFAAFSSRCTHAGCKVDLPEDGRVVCTCHNSVFDGRGMRESGPASRDLEKYSATIKKNIVVITAL